MHLDDYTLARYLEDQVAGQEKQHLVAHLADCPACCEAVASAYRMVQAVAEAEAPLPDPAAVRRAERLVTAPARGAAESAWPRRTWTASACRRQPARSRRRRRKTGPSWRRGRSLFHGRHYGARCAIG